jgi:hypothetical protein
MKTSKHRREQAHRYRPSTSLGRKIVQLWAVQVPTAVVAVTAALGCDGAGTSTTWDGPPKGGTKAKSSAERLVDVPGGSVEAGFAIGVIRKTKMVGGFSISKYPVTRGEYLACVEAGACKKSEAPRCVEPATPDRLGRTNVDEEAYPKESPAVCVGVDQAEKYCRWANGGSLPTLEQWMLAARGPSVSRYAWGSSDPTCAQHPKAVKKDDQTSCELADPSPVEVGKHADGASSSGTQDVLLTRAELLRRSTGSSFSACEPSKSADASAGDGSCLVYSLDPGAIDSVQAMPAAKAKAKDKQNDKEDGAAAVEVSPVPYGFRCVWNGEVSK